MGKLFGSLKQFCILQLPMIPYCVSLIMVTLTRHDFVNIFQMEHFSAVKFAKGYEKNISYLVTPKSPKVGQKLNKSDWAPLNKKHYFRPTDPTIQKFHFIARQQFSFLGLICVLALLHTP